MGRTLHSPQLDPNPNRWSTNSLNLSPKKSIGPGTYQVGADIKPGVYAGKVGTGALDSCYWERLRGVSGAFEDILANDNAIGQFYVEVLSSDKFFKIACDITPLADWKVPSSTMTELEPGTYLVSRDMEAGTYRGEAGTGVLESCYWARLTGL